MTLEVLTRVSITRNLDALSHGGKEAITLFLEMSRRLHKEGAEEALRDWITIAAPALPEKERNEVLVSLMCSYLYLNRRQLAEVSPASVPSFH